MKQVLTIILFWVSQPIYAQDFTKDSLEIAAIMEMQERCWNEGSIDCFMKGYWRSDSLQFIGKSGITYGWNETLNNYKSKYPDRSHMGALHFTLLHMKKLGQEFITVTGSWKLDREIGNAGGYFTLLWQKIEGKWVIIADHSS